MRPLLVVFLDPRIKISLQLLQCPIDRFPEGHAKELVQDRLMESFANPVGLGMPRVFVRV